MEPPAAPIGGILPVVGRHWWLGWYDGAVALMEEAMTTDEMILALVATGKFTLPEELEVVGVDLALRSQYFDEVGQKLDIKCILLKKRIAHDLCAMHFAREAKNIDLSAYEWQDSWWVPLTTGDSAAAIKALWEAVRYAL